MGAFLNFLWRSSLYAWHLWYFVVMSWHLLRWKSVASNVCNSAKSCLLTGVIKYVGHVSFAEGLWLGVALKTPKGKHDGCVQGRRYFTCKPGHGLLVRPSRVSVRGINGAQLRVDWYQFCFSSVLAFLSTFWSAELFLFHFVFYCQIYAADGLASECVVVPSLEITVQRGMFVSAVYCVVAVVVNLFIYLQILRRSGTVLFTCWSVIFM